MADKPYPWTCGNCAQKRVEPVVRDYEIDFKHDGKLHNIVLSRIEIPTCQNCGTVQTGIEIGDKVTNALRDKVGLLFPEEIKKQRTALNLSQEQLSAKPTPPRSCQQTTFMNSATRLSDCSFQA